MTKEYKGDWYDRVYLCYEETKFKAPNTQLPIIGFNCYRYSSFPNADAGWKNDRLEYKDVRQTMIPMCKWVPEIFDRYILNWKLKNMYWKGKIWTGKGYNRT
jgi:aminopeptidase-like protein